MMEFHISRWARDRYKFDQALFSFSGNVIFANFHASRVFSQRLNERRNVVQFPERSVKASQVNAMGLIDEILHYVIQLYSQEQRGSSLSGDLFQDLLTHLVSAFGQDLVTRIIKEFTHEFPPVAVYRGEITVEEYLEGTIEGRTNISRSLEELVMLWVANRNPAQDTFLDLFDDSSLESKTGYLQVMGEIQSFFNRLPVFGPDNQHLIELLRSPAIAVPYSLEGQLEYIREHWRGLLGEYLYRLLSSLDFIQEERKVTMFVQGVALVPEYHRYLGMEDLKRFSQDRDWMASLVLIAKNIYVWLDQMSKKHQRRIDRLDQIPDEELSVLADSGINGLWLIGIWERSPASRTIKQLCGNPEAIASAYSIYEYSIAGELGGESAYLTLKDQAWRHGIRMGSDMVPNHMGIDSKWVHEHPDWFISVDYPPFPAYRFEGPNLSSYSGAEIYLENHYYDRSDAAVVFKHINHSTGQHTYVYHGNDGTSMPWNDTAQLNYLKPEVREAAIQTILNVARQFPIIRFDAAMTLAKKHYQRLWFPQPGSGGDIPSRAEFGLTKEQFDQSMPEEFWREVVDRMAVEVPDTLLLAEAFWLMEGYFVRTLGMHRVYNSAFMNMLRDEDNAKYRTVLKNTLEFDPQIMKRFVNFMNNPDERTAVDQFGKGDKYFGICTLMATLPGLPMFGHGQIEGFTEKYGMEYKRAYMDEYPDGHLVERHRREIFPLLRMRKLFAEVDHFKLYDFHTTSGFVNEDVYAFSNRLGEKRALVVYHNRYAETNGWVQAGIIHSSGLSGNGHQGSLMDGLGFSPAEDAFLIFKDHISGLWYIRPSQEVAEKGLYFSLDAYRCHVMVEFQLIKDDEWETYHNLNAYLNGRGVPSLENLREEFALRPVLLPFSQIVNPGYFEYLLKIRNEFTKSLPEEIAEQMEPVILEVQGKLTPFYDGALTIGGGNWAHHNELVAETLQMLSSYLDNTRLRKPDYLAYQKSVKWLFDKAVKHVRNSKANELILLVWLFVCNIGKTRKEVDQRDYEVASRSSLEEWHLGNVIMGVYASMGYKDHDAWKMLGIVKLLVTHQNWLKKSGGEKTIRILERWLNDIDVAEFIGVNRYQDVLWFNREAMEEFLNWMVVMALYSLSLGDDQDTNTLELFITCSDLIRNISDAVKRSEYKIENLLDMVR